MNTFDIRAKDWDKEQIHIIRSKAIAGKVKSAIKISPLMSGFEYGSGTGLLSFELLDSFKNITLADSSAGMIEALNEKIKKNNIKNIKSILLDLEKENIPAETFDVIFTQMTMHHIANTELVLEKFYLTLNKDGYICIADLFKEDGSFHGNEFTGHAGFDPETFKFKMENAGFSFVKHEECFIIKKIIEGKKKIFPIFLMTGQKIE
jgi:ubiquinone/menaquinone biosynthesis C-methylase UbiE